MRGLFTAAAVIAAIAAALLGISAVLAPVAAERAEEDLQEIMALMLPGGTAFTPEEYTGEDGAVSAVWKGAGGYVVETAVAGYVDNIVMLVGVDHDGFVTGLMVREMAETYGLGGSAMTDPAFLAQFLGTNGTAAVGTDIDAIAGATVTSRAVTRGVNAACAYVTGADISSTATEWGEW